MPHQIHSQHSLDPQRPRRASILALVLSALSLLFLHSSVASAALMYDFVQSGTGDVLATVELSGLPATWSEVVGFSFTAAGGAIFGYSPGSVAFTFDQSLATFIDDGIGGLRGSATDVDAARIYDANPPFPPPSSFGPVDAFVLWASSQSSDPDFITSSGLPPYPSHTATGDWRLQQAAVPEPASLVVWTVLAGAALWRCAAVSRQARPPSPVAWSNRSVDSRCHIR